MFSALRSLSPAVGGVDLLAGKGNTLVEEWRHLRDFGLRIHQERLNLAKDSLRLAEAFERISQNHSRAVVFLEELRVLRQQKVDECRALQGVALRQAEIALAEIEGLEVLHSLKRDLFGKAVQRIYGILRLNEIFSEMLAELALQVRTVLLSSLDILRSYAREEIPPDYLWREWKQALGRLQHPYQTYHKLEQGWRRQV